MKTSSHSPSAIPRGKTQKAALQDLTEEERRALELKEHAEHETGVKREKLQKQAVQKSG